jgi:hypothetical protein
MLPPIKVLRVAVAFASQNVFTSSNAAGSEPNLAAASPMDLASSAAKLARSRSNAGTGKSPLPALLITGSLSIQDRAPQLTSA